jgi:hypothetical protein
MNTTTHNATCGCCNADITITVDAAEKLSVDHPQNGCLGARAIRISDDISAHLIEKHRALMAADLRAPI